MKWRRVPKEKASQPKRGNYKLWKEMIAREGFYQCVYCALPEPQLGGQRNFHVEHYKPKKKFPKLKNDIKNLFYACPICNVFKGDGWPGEPPVDHSISCFPNPSIVDYNDLFDVDFERGTVDGRFIASKYLVSILHLNRPQLILERRTYLTDVRTKIVLIKCSQLIARLREVEDEKATALLSRMAQLILEITNLEIDVRRIRPYSPDQLN